MNLVLPKRFLSPALLLALALGCAPEPEPLRIGLHPWTGYAPIYLARAEGRLSPQKVHFVDFNYASQSTQALRNRRLDGALLTLDEFLMLWEDGVDLEAALILNISQGADKVLARPEIPDLAGLRGMRIGVENTAVGAVMFDALLEAAGLRASEVQMVPEAVNAQALAYEQGLIDAAVTYDPYALALQNLGARVLFDSRRTPDLIVDILVLRRDLSQAHKEASRDLLKAYFQAAERLKTPDEAIVRALAPHLGVEPDQVSPLFEDVDQLGEVENRLWLEGPGALFPLRAEALRNRLVRRGLLQGPETGTASRPAAPFSGHYLPSP